MNLNRAFLLCCTSLFTVAVMALPMVSAATPDRPSATVPPGTRPSPSVQGTGVEMASEDRDPEDKGPPIDPDDLPSPRDAEPEHHKQEMRHEDRKDSDDDDDRGHDADHDRHHDHDEDHDRDHDDEDHD